MHLFSKPAAALMIFDSRRGLRPFGSGKLVGCYLIRSRMECQGICQLGKQEGCQLGKQEGERSKTDF